MVEFLEATNSVPMLGDFAGTALLQLQAPAADRATMIMIMEGLACALRLPSSTPAAAKNLEQQTCEARTGANRRLYCCACWEVDTARPANGRIPADICAGVSCMQYAQAGHMLPRACGTCLTLPP
jgi:hypothetical protein